MTKETLSNENKKKATPIIKELVVKYPGHLALLYYFLKVKYSVSLE